MTEEEFFSRAKAFGGKAYLVGGAVRDRILGLSSHDRDYVVCGFDENRFQAAFPESRKIGKAFPVFLVEIGGSFCEVAFARKERKTAPGSRGFAVENSPATTIEEDLYRRDTTINAIALDSEGRLIDPFGGAADARAGILRAVSGHFIEDPLRALRAARQAAQFRMIIEPGTLAMMARCAEELRNEAAERKFLELRKVLSIAQPSLFFRNLLAAGLLEQEFPWLFRLIGQSQPQEPHPEGDAFEHSMEVLDRASELCEKPEIRFAALFHDVGKGLTPPEELPHHTGHDEAGARLIPQIAASLRLPSRWRDWALFAAREHMRAFTMTKPKKIRDLLIKLTRPPLSPEDFAAILKADNVRKGGTLPLWLQEAPRLTSAMRHAGPIPDTLQGPARGRYLRDREIAVIRAELNLIEEAKKGRQ